MKTPARTIAPYSTLLPFASGRPSLRRALLWTCIAGFAIGSGATAHATNSTWINTNTTGNWEDSSKWNGGVIPGGVGSIVGFNAGTNNQTVTITAPETVGVLNFGGNYTTLAASGTGTLTMDNGGSGAQINNTGSGAYGTISAQIVLADAGGLYLTDNSTYVGTNTFLLSGGITSTLTASITNNGTGTHGVRISGAITGANLKVVQNSATSVLFLYGANTFNGLYINTGTVALANNATAAGAGTIFLGSGAADATLASVSGGGTTYANDISVAAGGARTIDNSSANSRYFSGAITLANDLTVKESGTTGYNFALQGNISGTGNINIINNSGIFALSGASVDNAGGITYSGVNTVTGTFSGALGSHVTGITQNSSSSTLLLSGSNTAFTGAVNVNAGTLKLGNVNAVNANNVVTFGGAGTFDVNGNAVTIAGLNDGVGTGTVTNSGASAKVLTLGGTGNYTFGGVITAATPANLAVTKTGAGTQTFTGANTYTGATTITGGTLQLGDGTTGHDGSVAGNITNNSALVYKLFGSQTYGRNITGTGSVAKSGAGVLTLSGSNNYTGATNVNGGKLIVSGSLSATTSLSVTNGAELNVNGMINSASTLSLGTGKLSGSGSVGAVTVNSGGTLSPGNGTGSLTLSATSLALKDGGTFQLDLNSIETGVAGTNWGKVAVSGALDLTNLTSFTLSLQTLDNLGAASALTGWNPNVNHTWSSVVTFGSLTGTFESSDFTVDTTNFVGDTSGGSFSLVQNGNALDLQYQAVPEPSTWASFVGGLGMLIMFRQYRKRMSA